MSKGVEASTIETFGYGKTQPVPEVKCDDKLKRKQLIECLAPNRRVVVEVKGDAQVSVHRAIRTPPAVGGVFFAAMHRDRPADHAALADSHRACRRDPYRACRRDRPRPHRRRASGRRGAARCTCRDAASICPSTS